jgi:hypothetical protein
MFHTRPCTRLGVERLEDREVPAVLFAVNGGGRLLMFDSANPGVLLGGLNITGMVDQGEFITDIDVRPGSGGLYGRSTSDRLYLISPLSGFATRIGDVVPTAASNVGIDFDPLTDRLRVASNIGENITINPVFGSLAGVGSQLTYAPGDIFQGQTANDTALGYTNSYPFAPFTILYANDHFRNTLGAIGITSTPDDGQVFTVGFLGIDTTAATGFDIDPVSGTAFATLKIPGLSFSVFCSIDLFSGAATVLGPVGANRFVNDIAVARPGTTFGGAVFFPTVTTPVLSPGIPATVIVPTTLTLDPGIPSSVAFPSLTQPLSPGLFGPTAFVTPSILDPMFTFSLDPFLFPTGF